MGQFTTKYISTWRIFTIKCFCHPSHFAMFPYSPCTIFTMQYLSPLYIKRHDSWTATMWKWLGTWNATGHLHHVTVLKIVFSECIHDVGLKTDEKMSQMFCGIIHGDSNNWGRQYRRYHKGPIIESLCKVRSVKEERRLNFCMVVELEKIHKYKLFRGRRERGLAASMGDHSLR